MIRIFTLGLAALLAPMIAALPGFPAAADEPEVMKRLQTETVTVFDAGIKRLRRAAIEGAGRLGSAAEPGPQTRVWYDVDTGSIEIVFRFTVPPGDAGAYLEPRCLERRKAALRETFNIGKTIYAVPLTFDERVRRRLGSLFIREPVQRVTDVAALGQRLAELTFMSAEIVGRENVKIFSCRDRVAPVMGARPKNG